MCMEIGDTQTLRFLRKFLQNVKLILIKQIFENANYFNKNIVSVSFTREKAEHTDKARGIKFNSLFVSPKSYMS